jgi:hypothetical protein
MQGPSRSVAPRRALDPDMVDPLAASIPDEVGDEPQVRGGG